MKKDKKHSGNFYYINSGNHLTECMTMPVMPYKSRHEALEDRKYNQKYPMGTFLSKCVEIAPVIINEIECDSTFECISQIINSYFDITCTKEETMEVLKEYLLRGTSLLLRSPKKIWMSEIDKIDNYITFIETCSQYKEHCNLLDLESFSSAINESLVRCERIVTNFDIDILVNKSNHRRLNVGFIHDALSQDKERYEEIFKSFKIVKSNNLPAPFSKLIENVHRNKSLLLYSNCYKINSIKDLLSASLQEIFTSGHIIKRCEYENCARCFVPMNRSDEKYCNYKNPENPKTCKEIVDLENRKKRYKNTENQRIHKIITSKLYNRKIYASSTDDEKALTKQLIDFQVESQELREQVKAGTLTNDAYASWLKKYNEEM